MDYTVNRTFTLTKKVLEQLRYIANKTTKGNLSECVRNLIENEHDLIKKPKK